MNKKLRQKACENEKKLARVRLEPAASHTLAQRSATVSLGASYLTPLVCTLYMSFTKNPIK